MLGDTAVAVNPRRSAGGGLRGKQRGPADRRAGDPDHRGRVRRAAGAAQAGIRRIMDAVRDRVSEGYARPRRQRLSAGSAA